MWLEAARMRGTDTLQRQVQGRHLAAQPAASPHRITSHKPRLSVGRPRRCPARRQLDSHRDTHTTGRPAGPGSRNALLVLAQPLCFRGRPGTREQHTACNQATCASSTRTPAVWCAMLGQIMLTDGSRPAGDTTSSRQPRLQAPAQTVSLGRLPSACTALPACVARRRQQYTNATRRNLGDAAGGGLPAFPSHSGLKKTHGAPAPWALSVLPAAHAHCQCYSVRSRRSAAAERARAPVIRGGTLTGPWGGPG